MNFALGNGMQRQNWDVRGYGLSAFDRDGGGLGESAANSADDLWLTNEGSRTNFRRN
jgi:hypothetical protein